MTLLKSLRLLQLPSIVLMGILEGVVGVLELIVTGLVESMRFMVRLLVDNNWHFNGNRNADRHLNWNLDRNVDWNMHLLDYRYCHLLNHWDFNSLVDWNFLDNWHWDRNLFDLMVVDCVDFEWDVDDPRKFQLNCEFEF